MTCYDVRAKLSALLDGAVTPDEKGRLLGHVDGCADCRSELDSLAATDRVVRHGLNVAVERSTPSGYFESFAERVLERAGLAPNEQQEVGRMDVITKPTPKVEMTGLHDLQLMARTTKERLAQKNPDEAEDLLAAVSTSGSFGQVVLPEPGREVAPPVMTAPPPAATARISGAMQAAVPASGFGAGVVARKPSRLPAVLMSLIVVLGAAGVGVWYLLPRYLAKQQAAEPAVAAVESAPAEEPAPAAAAPAPAATPATTPTPTVEPMPENGTVALAEPTEKAADEDGDKAKDKEKPGKRAKERAEKAEKTAEAPKPTGAKPEGPAAAAAAAPPKGESKGGESQNLDDLLNEAGGAPAPKPDKPAAPAEGKPASKLPEMLTSAQVRDGMATVRARVQACYDSFKVGGLVEIKVKIESDGTIGSSEAVGKFAGTETGGCVAEAVKHAAFPSFSGPPMSFKYPFRLQ